MVGTKIQYKRSSIVKGFTIVELLIVIVVIAILAAISIVAYTGIQERSRMSAALSYAAQIKHSPDMLDATAIYNFEDCTAGMTSVQDSSEKKNNGTVVGTGACSTDTPSGSGKSFSFNGSTLINTAAEIGNSFYIKAAWVKMTDCSASSNNNIISTPVSNSGSVIYAPLCLIRTGHNSSWNITAGTFDDGKWHYVVTKYENGTLSISVDGKSLNKAAAATPSSLSNQVGGYNGANRITGLMDDVVIIGR